MLSIDDIYINISKTQTGVKESLISLTWWPKKAQDSLSSEECKSSQPVCRDFKTRN